MGLTGSPGHTSQAGSSVGHDNHYVFREILNLSAFEMQRLIKAGAIEEMKSVASTD